MKRILLAIIAIALLSGNIKAQETNNLNIIEVSASASKEVTPDEIFITILINEKDNNGKISVAQQEKEMIKALESAGIDIQEALTVNDMESTLKKNILKKDNIFVSKNYTLKVNSATTAANAIAALNNLNIARADITRIAVSAELERQTKNQLLKEAAQKAQENAGIMAEAVGCKAGKAVYMQNSYRYNYAANGLLTSTKSANVTEEMPLHITKSNIYIDVHCKFQLLH